jgi:hypothetical protein
VTFYFVLIWLPLYTLVTDRNWISSRDTGIRDRAWFLSVTRIHGGSHIVAKLRQSLRFRAYHNSVTTKSDTLQLALGYNFCKPTSSGKISDKAKEINNDFA